MRDSVQEEKTKMNGQTSKALRIALLVFAILWGVYGLLHVVSPELMMARDPSIERVLGAAVVTFALGAALAYREKAWDKVKIVVLVLIASMILYTVTMAWGILAGGISSAAWPPTIIGAVFAIVLTVLYTREK
jgi:hypothetical protein